MFDSKGGFGIDLLEVCSLSARMLYNQQRDAVFQNEIRQFEQSLDMRLHLRALDLNAKDPSVRVS